MKVAGEVGVWIRKFLNSPIWKEIIKTSRDIRDIPRKITDDSEIQRTLEDIDYTFRRKDETIAERESKE